MARPAPAAAALAVVVGVAAGLRIGGGGQSLFGDELFTYWGIHGRFFHSILAVEITPPLYFLLAWVTAHVGDSPEAIRWPSIVLGTATVPLVYLLGRRLLDRRAGLAGAALFAVSPFAVYYGTEGRAYATALFLTVLSTLLLLAALRRGGTGWWIGFAVCAAAALLTHYTTGLVLAAQAVWVLRAYPEQRRTLVLAHAGAVALFLLWLPGLLEQQRYPSAGYLAALARPAGARLWQVPARMLVGDPYISLGTVPGAVGLALIGAGVAVALIAPARRRAPVGLGLVAIAAVAAPLGGLIWSLIAPGHAIYSPRNISASLPYLLLLAGFLLTRPRAPAAAAAATVLAAGGLAIGGWREVTDLRRTPLDEAARLIDAQARPGDAVLDLPVLTGGPVRRDFTTYFRRRDVPVTRLGVFSATPARLGAVWRRLASHPRVWAVGVVVGDTVAGAPPGPGWRPVSLTTLGGRVRQGVALFVRVPQGGRPPADHPG